MSEETMQDLLDRLASATPDPSLDADLTTTFIETNWPPNFHGLPTRSIDDAFALAPPRLGVWVLWRHHHPIGFGAEIIIKIKRKKNIRKETFDGYGATPAIALCTAIVKARAAEGGSRKERAA